MLYSLMDRIRGNPFGSLSFNDALIYLVCTPEDLATTISEGISAGILRYRYAMISFSENYRSDD